MPDHVTDEQLWSWVDRSAPELAAHLDQYPQEQQRVDGLREILGVVQDQGGLEQACPESIGPYQIHRKLGTGGMGVVYDASRSMPNRRAAVKVVRTWLDDRDQKRLIQREASALARLQHSSIASLFEVGETDAGLPWFAMELVVGEPIDKWCLSNDSNLADRVRLVAKIAGALAHAHEAGVIHRDLKPSNILVTANGEPKVLDFGLARFVDPGGNMSMTLSSPDKILGTVRYMSPEQARGELKNVGEASDVYSLGVVLCELITGRHPHGLERSTFLEAARAINEKPVKLDTSMGRRLDSGLVAITLRALAKDPWRRYASAGAFAQDLERYLRGEPVEARRDSRMRRVFLWALRNKLSASLILFMVVMAILFELGGIWQEVLRELDNLPGFGWL